MKNCTNCAYAKWDKTTKGKLHPSGDGKCTFEYKINKLPASMYWVGSTPNPAGGLINRRVELKYHCPYFSRK